MDSEVTTTMGDLQPVTRAAAFQAMKMCAATRAADKKARTPRRIDGAMSLVPGSCRRMG